MTTKTKGYIGAKVASWSNGPKAIIRHLAETNTTASRDVLVEMFTVAIQRSKSHAELDAVIRHWATNAINNWLGPEAKKPPTLEEQRRIAAKREARTKSRDVGIARGQDALANHVESRAVEKVGEIKMANGKKVRLCSGSELLHVGGAFTRMAFALKPDQLAGELGDKKMNELYDGTI